jgi:transcriptional regulator with XRE-family HTH domain
MYNIVVMITEKEKQEDAKVENKNIGKRLSRLRKEKGLTQKELASKMGVPWTLISDYERGKLRLHNAILKKFAVALSITTDKILGLEVESPKNNAITSLKLNKRLQKIAKLPITDQKALLKIIDGYLKGVQK